MFATLMGLKTVAPAELQQLVREGKATVLDVNSRESWEQARVPSARHLDPQGFAEADLPSDKDSLLVFYCSNPLCRKAPNAARRAKDMGYRNVRVLSAGIKGWQAAKLPTDSGAA